MRGFGSWLNGTQIKPPVLPVVEETGFVPSEMLVELNKKLLKVEEWKRIYPSVTPSAVLVTSYYKHEPTGVIIKNVSYGYSYSRPQPTIYSNDTFKNEYVPDWKNIQFLWAALETMIKFVSDKQAKKYLSEKEQRNKEAADQILSVLVK